MTKSAYREKSKMSSNSLKTIKHTIISTSIALAMLCGTNIQAAGLQTVLNEQFNTMSNFTQPGVYESQRRGVLSGGSMVARTPLVNTQIVSMTPPGWKAGCGGIDLFAGSFSFINGEQFIQLLRSIASNAAGYAFDVALKTVCGECLDTINSLQNKMQALNEFAGNSCQLAQGIVNTATDNIGFIDQKDKTNVRLYNGKTGLVDDFLQAWTESGGKDNETALREKDNAKYKEIVTGNLVWRQIKRNEISRNFVGVGTLDNEFLEEVMSFTGTIIHEDQVTGEHNTKTNPRKVYTPIIKLSDLIEGGRNVVVYRCQDNNDIDGCLALVQKKENIQGLRDRLINALVGEDRTSGIIGKYARHTSEIEFTQEEKNIVAALPASIGSGLRNLALSSQEAAVQAAMHIAGQVAVDMTYNTAKEILRAVERSLQNAKSSTTVEELTPLLDRNGSSLESEYAQMRAKYGDINDAMNYLNNIRQNARVAEVWFPETRSHGNSNAAGES